jgi:hypothetical protein
MRAALRVRKAAATIGFVDVRAPTVLRRRVITRAAPAPGGSTQMMSSQTPAQQSSSDPLFLALICAGYLGVAFFFFLMFRTVVLPGVFSS